VPKDSQEMVVVVAAAAAAVAVVMMLLRRRLRRTKMKRTHHCSPGATCDLPMTALAPTRATTSRVKIAVAVRTH